MFGDDGKGKIIGLGKIAISNNQSLSNYICWYLFLLEVELVFVFREKFVSVFVSDHIRFLFVFEIIRICFRIRAIRIRFRIR